MNLSPSLITVQGLLPAQPHTLSLSLSYPPAELVIHAGNERACVQLQTCAVWSSHVYLTFVPQLSARSQFSMLFRSHMVQLHRPHENITHTHGSTQRTSCRPHTGRRLGPLGVGAAGHLQGRRGDCSCGEHVHVCHGNRGALIISA